MRWADRDIGAVMLGDLRELRVEPVGIRNHRGRHPVDPPDEAGATEAEQDLVQRAGHVPERHLLAEQATEPRGCAPMHEMLSRNGSRRWPVPSGTRSPSNSSGGGAAG
jgi:hypothetical protein